LSDNETTRISIFTTAASDTFLLHVC